eukprot:CAMPEP_0119323098 /NCGR_PEP_ID=MMETSP1333-20130426/59999_1 /TAXON_ID=418940 /ORGANISM="Scyphosphaera apsteinii, Strain RCC1455" /LENGTH=393 /DNA_ID=CAMNT_0007330475 /DNA_START=143 /DNA_END=1324 /DNA_ORIENTATION=+
MSALGPGSVVVAAPGSFDHYYLEGLVLVIEDSESSGTRGVLLNHQTPWQVYDMNPMLSAFSQNTVFLGGDAGRDTMIMLHSEAGLPNARHVGGVVWQGGVAAAEEAVENGELDAEQFKFFYKTCEWLPGQLNKQLDQGLWEVAELSPSLLFGQSGQREMWSLVRSLLLHTKNLRVKLSDMVTRKAEEEQAKSEAAVTEDSGEAKETRGGRQAGAQTVGEAVDAIEAIDAAAGAAWTAGADGKANGGMETLEAKERNVSKAQEAKSAAAWLAEKGILPREVPTGSIYEAAARVALEVEAAEASKQGERMAGATVAEVVEETKAAEALQQTIEGVDTQSSDAGIVAVLGYRFFLGNEQWRVRWANSDEETWEVLRVLDTDALRSEASRLRELSTD